MTDRAAEGALCGGVGRARTGHRRFRTKTEVFTLVDSQGDDVNLKRMCGLCGVTLA
jgi:hypothetical protein